MSSRLVYSTETGRMCPDCGKVRTECDCKSRASKSAPVSQNDGIVRIRRETRGRRGKTVTIIDGLGTDAMTLARIATSLKKHCGTGGSVTAEHAVEVQGDKREQVKRWLDEQGFKTRLAGG